MTLLDVLRTLPGILLAQIFGICAAFVADQIAWDARKTKGELIAAQISCLVLGWPVLLIPFAAIFWIDYGFLIPLGIIGWLIFVANVQRRQMNVSFGTALGGAFFQFFVFSLGILIGSIGSLMNRSASSDADWPFLFWLVTAGAAYVLSALFRPTIAFVFDEIRRFLR